MKEPPRCVECGAPATWGVREQIDISTMEDAARGERRFTGGTVYGYCGDCRPDGAKPKGYFDMILTVDPDKKLL